MRGDGGTGEDKDRITGWVGLKGLRGDGGRMNVLEWTSQSEACQRKINSVTIPTARESRRG